MKNLIFCLILIFFVGCDKMSREDVIKAVKQCNDANMESRIIFDFWTGYIDDVWCIVK